MPIEFRPDARQHFFEINKDNKLVDNGHDLALDKRGRERFSLTEFIAVVSGSMTTGLTMALGLLVVFISTRGVSLDKLLTEKRPLSEQDMGLFSIAFLCLVAPAMVGEWPQPKNSSDGSNTIHLGFASRRALNF